MWTRENEKCVGDHLNWIAIVSYAGSLTVSLAIWLGVFRAVQLLLK